MVQIAEKLDKTLEGDGAAAGNFRYAGSGASSSIQYLIYDGH